MSAKQVLDGINALRDLINHPNLSDAEKIAALKNAVEPVRNDIQDLVSTIFENFAPEISAPATEAEESDAYDELNKREVTELIFFYKKSVFLTIESSAARASLAKILLRIAKEKEVNAPALWVNIAASAGEINEE